MYFLVLAFSHCAARLRSRLLEMKNGIVSGGMTSSVRLDEVVAEGLRMLELAASDDAL